MRVLHFFKTYLPDSFTGIERVIWQIAEATHPLGVQSDVLSLSPTPAAAPVAIGTHRSHQVKQDLYVASTGLSLSVFGQYRRLAREADLVHFHFPWPMMDLVQLLSGVDKPFVVTYHSDIVKQQGLLQIYRPLMHHFLGRAARIVATSPTYLRTSPVLARYAGKTSAIPIGIDAAEPPNAERLRFWRDRLGDRFFLFVGALRYYKGLPFLLDAARETGLTVVLAGSGDEEMVTQAGLGNVVTLGQVDEPDKLALLALCTAFVFPSHLRSEAFGVALLEAARAGKPMISCEIGTGTSYVNSHGDTGLVVPPADSRALAQAMRTLWDDEALCLRMGGAARTRYLELFTAEKMGRAYKALYDEVLDGTR